MIWLHAARVFSIFAVVLLHVAASVVTEQDVGTPAWWYGNFYDSLVRWCVPVFVMISGALLLRNDKAESITVFYRKRATRVLIPLIVWTVVFLFWKADRATFSLADLNVTSVARSIASGRPHYHLWFLFMIISLYLFTPFIRILVRNATRTELWLLVGLLFGIAALHEIAGVFIDKGLSLFVYWFLSYLPYFLCGHLIATSEKRVARGLLLTVFGGSVVLTAAGCYFLSGAKDLMHGLYFYENLSITVIPMSVSLMWLFKQLSFNGMSSKTFRQLSELSLGVYLIHPLFLESFRRFAFRQEHYFPLLSVPVIAVVMFGVSLLAAFLLYRIPYLKRVI